MIQALVAFVAAAISHRNMLQGVQHQRCRMLSSKQSAAPVVRRAIRSRAVRMDVRAAAAKPQIMVNSVAGKMGQAVAEATVRAGLELVPYTLAAAEVVSRTKEVEVAGHKVQLVGPDTRDTLLPKLKQQYPQLVMVDYTVPDAIHEMAGLYIKHRTPFVMGTTGGDRAKLLKDVQDAGVYAVIAPNMGKQIVAFQVRGAWQACVGLSTGRRAQHGHVRTYQGTIAHAHWEGRCKGYCMGAGVGPARGLAEAT